MFIRNVLLIPFIILFALLGCSESTSKSPTEAEENTASSLNAHAGSDAFIATGNSHALSASLSTSSDGITAYEWSLSEIVSGDSSALVTIGNSTQENTNISFSSITTTTIFKIGLTVTDSTGLTATDFVDITVSYNSPADLTINAGSDINASSPASVSLSGTILDNGVTIAKIRWLQVSGSKLVTLNNSDTLTPTFTAPWLDPSNNTLIFKLNVTDTDGNSVVDEVTVAISNTLPLADPGTSRVALNGNQVNLDGSGSKSINGGVPASYLWEPVGTNTVSLTSANSAIASFTAPIVTQATDFEFNLTVTDNNGQTDTQTIIISVSNQLTYNDFGGRYYGVDLDTVNKVAYMAKGEGGLGIYDVSVPTNIQPLAIFNTSGNAQDVLIANGYAYIADQFNDLVIVNISNPATPTLAAHLAIDAFGNRATALAKHGDYLYLAGFYAGLVTIDIQNPQNPVVLSSVDTADKALGIKVSVDGQYAYLADSNSVIVFDLSNPATPAPLFTILTSNDAYDVALNENYLYVADGVNGLKVYDVANKAISPILLTTINTNGVARKVILNNSVLTLADGNQGLKLYDISTPNTPTLISSYNTSGDTEDVAALANHIVVADSYAGMSIIDFSDVNSPIVTSAYTTIGTGKGISIKDNYAYVADFYNGLVILDISNPFSPKLASHLSYDKESRGITVAGNHAFIANGNNGLRIIDITDPLNPQNISIASLSLNVAQSVTLSDNETLAYVAGFYGGLYVVDIADKTNPQALAFNNFGGSQSKFVTQLNDTVYVANGDHSFAISNIVNPNIAPNTAVLLPTSFSAIKTGDGHMVAVKGDYAYLAHNAAGLAVIDVSNSVAPSIIGEYTGNIKSINSVFIHNSTLFATNSNVDSQLKGTDDFLIAWDITNQGALSDIPDASLDIGGQYPAIDSIGNYLIMVGEGVKTINVTNPLNPLR